MEVNKGGEVIFSKITESPQEVAKMMGLYANHATCVVTVTYVVDGIHPSNGVTGNTE